MADAAKVTSINRGEGGQSADTAATEGRGSAFLGTPTEATVPKQDGKLQVSMIAELFVPYEGDEVIWAKRFRPAPETLLEVFPIDKTCDAIAEAAKSLSSNPQLLALRLPLMKGVAEHCTSIVPRGGSAGAWLLFWEGRKLKWAFLYRSEGTSIGCLVLDYENDEPIPGHEGHVLVVPKKR